MNLQTVHQAVCSALGRPPRRRSSNATLTVKAFRRLLARPTETMERALHGAGVTSLVVRAAGMMIIALAGNAARVYAIREDVYLETLEEVLAARDGEEIDGVLLTYGKKVEIAHA